MPGTIEPKMGQRVVDAIQGLTTSLGAGFVASTRSINGHALSSDVILTASDVGAQPSDADLTAIALLTTTAFGRSFLALVDAAAARTLLALGTLATQNGTFSGTSSGTNTGDQDLSGLQPLDSDLTTIGGLSPSNDDVIQRKSGAWANRTLAQLISDLAALGTTFQPLDSDLTAIAALATTSFGRAFLALVDAAAGRTALGLGSLSTQSGTFSGTSSGTNTGDGYFVEGGSTASLALADSTTYYFGYGESATLALHTTYANAKMTVPKAGTIKRIHWHALVTTNGSNEAVSHFLRLNDTTDTTLSTSETYDPGANTMKVFVYSGLSIAVAAGDTIAFKVATPSWGTNPTVGSSHLLVWIE